MAEQSDVRPHDGRRDRRLSRDVRRMMRGSRLNDLKLTVIIVPLSYLRWVAGHNVIGNKKEPADNRAPTNAFCYASVYYLRVKYSRFAGE